jgi:palmitoyl-protein thioesterase
MGFSQGGQFLRGYVERFNDPPVRSLITWGSQHNGVADFPACATSDWTCKWAMRLAKSNIWSDWVRKNVIVGQYYRNPSDLETYLEKSEWLADVNNERDDKNKTYADNVKRLGDFVMIMFDNDKTVVPKYSSLFAEYDEKEILTPLRERQLYKEDWLGLKDLDKRGRLVMRVVKGEHMQIKKSTFKEIVKEYCGSR